METIKVSLNLWGRERQVVVSPLSGGDYQLYIDDFFQGQIIKRQGRYVFEYTNKCDLPGDDLQGLLDSLQGP